MPPAASSCNRVHTSSDLCAGPIHCLPGVQEERRGALLAYVESVQPGAVQEFVQTAAPGVVAAMQQTVMNVVGSLPPQYFEVKINTVSRRLPLLARTCGSSSSACKPGHCPRCLCTVLPAGGREPGTAHAVHHDHRLHVPERSGTPDPALSPPVGGSIQCSQH